MGLKRMNEQKHSQLQSEIAHALRSQLGAKFLAGHCCSVSRIHGRRVAVRLPGYWPEYLCLVEAVVLGKCPGCGRQFWWFPQTRMPEEEHLVILDQGGVTCVETE